jgi:hypothetical protein
MPPERKGSFNKSYTNVRICTTHLARMQPSRLYNDDGAADMSMC